MVEDRQQIDSHKYRNHNMATSEIFFQKNKWSSRLDYFPSTYNDVNANKIIHTFLNISKDYLI